jgi:hypothetical protein
MGVRVALRKAETGAVAVAVGIGLVVGVFVVFVSALLL